MRRADRKDFGGRVEPFDAKAAAHYVALANHRDIVGRPISLADAQIAAIASKLCATLATHNIDDFNDTGIDLIDPSRFAVSACYSQSSAFARSPSPHVLARAAACGGRHDACLRRHALKAFGGHVESSAFVLVADANQEDVAAIYIKGAEILDDDAFPVETGDLRDHMVADFQRVGRGCWSVGHE